VSVEGVGNLHAATAFLHGAAVEEMDEANLRPVMAEYPVVITARAAV
jgi:hypothetical protein